MTDQIDASFRACLLRPFFDLTARLEGPLMNSAPLIAYRSLVDGEPSLGLQRIVGGAFRENLRLCSGIRGTAVITPLEVSPERRTAEWHHVCELVESYGQIEIGRRARLLRLLVYLSFHRLVLALAPRLASHEIAASHDAATIATLRAVALNVLNAGRRYDTRELVAVVEHAPRHSRSRFYAAVGLLVYHAKITHNLSFVRRCRETMESYIRPVETRASDSFAGLMDLSRFYRTASYLHQLEGATDRVVAEMDLCEEIARELLTRAESPDEHAIALENMHPVLESRVREAEWLGDRALARARMEELVARDPWDSKVRLEYGELLARDGDLEAAALEFARAGRYGPPGVAPAHFLAGWCYERLGDHERAVAHQVSALRVDPHGISSCTVLGGSAAAIGLEPLSRWCEARSGRARGSGAAAVRRSASEIQHV